MGAGKTKPAPPTRFPRVETKATSIIISQFATLSDEAMKNGPLVVINRAPPPEFNYEVTAMRARDKRVVANVRRRLSIFMRLGGQRGDNLHLLVACNRRVEQIRTEQRDRLTGRLRVCWKVICGDKGTRGGLRRGRAFLNFCIRYF